MFVPCAGLSVFERNPSSFQLLGLDFLVTDDYNVWFIEANSYPLWPKTAPHKGKEHYIDKLMNHMAVSTLSPIPPSKQEFAIF